MTYSVASRALLGLAKDFPTAPAHKLASCMQAARTLGAYHVQGEARLSDEVIDWALTPEQALEYLMSKVPMSWRKVDGLSDGFLKSQAFWATGVEQIESLEALLGAMQTAMREGTPYAQFAKDWSARMRDEALGEGRLQTVFRTNMYSAYSGGRMASLNSNPGVKFLTYMTMGDRAVRPDHALMHGFTAPKDDAIWEQWTPPCGYNCRCLLRAADKDAETTPRDDPRWELPAEPGWENGSAGNPLNTFLADRASEALRLDQMPSSDPALGWVATSTPHGLDLSPGPDAEATAASAGFVTDPDGRALALTDPALSHADDLAPYLRSILQRPTEAWLTPVLGPDREYRMELNYLGRVDGEVVRVPVEGGVVSGSGQISAHRVSDPSAFRRGVRIV